jgi:hypothetical protein
MRISYCGRYSNLTDKAFKIAFSISGATLSLLLNSPYK